MFYNFFFPINVFGRMGGKKTKWCRLSIVKDWHARKIKSKMKFTIVLVYKYPNTVHNDSPEFHLQMSNYYQYTLFHRREHCHLDWMQPWWLYHPKNCAKCIIIDLSHVGARVPWIWSTYGKHLSTCIKSSIMQIYMLYQNKLPVHLNHNMDYMCCST